MGGRHGRSCPIKNAGANHGAGGRARRASAKQAPGLPGAPAPDRPPSRGPGATTAEGRRGTKARPDLKPRALIARGRPRDLAGRGSPAGKARGRLLAPKAQPPPAHGRSRGPAARPGRQAQAGAPRPKGRGKTGARRAAAAARPRGGGPRRRGRARASRQGTAAAAAASAQKAARPNRPGGLAARTAPPRAGQHEAPKRKRRGQRRAGHAPQAPRRRICAAGGEGWARTSGAKRLRRRAANGRACCAPDAASLDRGTQPARAAGASATAARRASGALPRGRSSAAGRR